LAFGSDWLRASLGDWLSFAVVIGYLFLLRVVAETIELKLRERMGSNENDS
jgi:hypothetical protein